jgi:hypothetical protein
MKFDVNFVNLRKNPTVVLLVLTVDSDHLKAGEQSYIMRSAVPVQC